jgi:hypothetical protein
MGDEIKIGDRVQIFLDANVWGSEGNAGAPWPYWFDGTVVRIDPYTQHRSFFWVQLDDASAALLGKGTRLISVLNPKNIRKA